MNGAQRSRRLVNPSFLVGKIPLDKGIIGWVFSQAQELIVLDLASHPHFSVDVDRLPGTTWDQTEKRPMLLATIQSQGEAIGVLCVTDPKERVFEPSDLAVLKDTGGMAGTAIRHAQLFESVQAARRRYHELFEDSVDPILVTDRHGRVIDANRQAEAMIGMDAETLRTQNIQDLHQLNLEKVGPGFSNLIGNLPLSYKSQIVSHREPDSASLEIPVQVHVHGIYDYDPPVDGEGSLQWILRDISEHVELDRMRDDLIAMVYHDLRSPLTNVVSSLDLLSTMPLEEFDPSCRPLVNIAIRSTERIQRLTNSLLDISRLEAGQLAVNRQKMDLRLLIEDALDAVASAANTKALTLEIDFAPLSPDEADQVKTLYEADIDVDMIRRVMVNLLENAVKFTPTKGTVRVGALRQDDFVEIAVGDSGPGIQQEDQERIFDKYTRLNLRGGPRGLGLGLAFCRLAIDAHGGHIWVESQPGEGSCFKV